MPRCKFSGVDDIMLSFKEVAELPDSVKEEMLSAEADVGIKFMQDSLRNKGLVSPQSTLLRSLKKRRKIEKDGSIVYLVSPTGTHHINNNGKKVRNGDVGFINEFGAPLRNIAAHNWMKDADERGADDIVDAGFKVYDDYLKSKNL